MAKTAHSPPLYKTTPYAHQLRCLAEFGNHKAFALNAEMGTGKSWIIMYNAAFLWEKGLCDAVLIFAPNGVQTNWTRLQLPAHMPDWVKWYAAAWSSGNSVAEQKLVESAVEPRARLSLNILTMNWEALPASGFDYALRFAKNARNLMIVCDESDEVKNPKAQRTKALMSLKRYSTYRRTLTGTPIDGTPFSAYSQYGFLDESILGTQSYTAFKAEYAEMLDKNHPLMAQIIKKNPRAIWAQIVAVDGDGKKKFRNLDKLHKLIAPHTFRVLKSECLDLPEKVYKTAYFKMTGAQAKIYKKAEQELRLAFDGNDTPFNRLTIAMKLSQITSGYYLHPMSPTEPVRIPGDAPKMDLLVDRVKAVIATGGKVIVWARYKVEITDILAALRAVPLVDDENHQIKINNVPQFLSCVRYDGEVKKDERTANLDAFEHGKAHVFVGNQQAGGTGITLVAASVVIYFSNNFRLRDRLQSEDRAHRIGQTKSVTYYNLVAKDTIDEAVVKALMDKKDVADIIVDGSILDRRTA